MLGHDTGGSNGWGELLDFEEAKTRRPLTLRGRARSLATGRDHTCVVLDDGEARCWGFGGRPVEGALHTSAANRRPLDWDPLDLPGPATKVMASGGSTCFALSTVPDQVCMGTGGLHKITWYPLRNTEGADPETGFVRVRHFAVDSFTSACLVDAEGRVRCWNASGLRGQPQAAWQGVPRCDSEGFITLPGPATMVSHGEEFACARLEDATVHCWGTSEHGVLGRGTTSTGPQAPAPVDVGGPVDAIASGYHHTCALMRTGSVRCWGTNGDGQLGYGHTYDIGDDETPEAAGDVPLGRDASPRQKLSSAELASVPFVSAMETETASSPHAAKARQATTATTLRSTTRS